MTNIDFIGKRRIFYTISITLILIGLLVSMPFAFGVKMDIQFKGGSIISYSYKDPSGVNGKMSTADTNALAAVVKKSLGTDVNAYLETDAISSKNNQNILFEFDKNITSSQVASLTAAIQKAYAKFNFTQPSVKTVAPSEGSDFFRQSILAVILASILIILYIWIRFRHIGGLPAGLTAFAALVHDLLIAFAAFSIFRIPLNDNFVAVLLTILGYSINDTIVIYDRIRENRRVVGSKMPFKDIVNLSINQSFSRSINTTLVVFIAITVVFIVSSVNHLTSISSFALPMMFGVVTGAYSTICIAGPLWVTWVTHKEKVTEQRKKAALAAKEAAKAARLAKKSAAAPSLPTTAENSQSALADNGTAASPAPQAPSRSGQKPRKKNKKRK